MWWSRRSPPSSWKRWSAGSATVLSAAGGAWVDWARGTGTVGPASIPNNRRYRRCWLLQALGESVPERSKCSPHGGPQRRNGETKAGQTEVSLDEAQTVNRKIRS